jgi:hypothetical protein
LTTDDGLTAPRWRQLVCSEEEPSWSPSRVQVRQVKERLEGPSPAAAGMWNSVRSARAESRGGFGAQPRRGLVGRLARDRARDGPKRLQARISAKSSLQITLQNKHADSREPGDLQGFLRAERRTSRTYPAWGWQTSPVLKPQRAGHRYRVGCTSSAACSEPVGLQEDRISAPHTLRERGEQPGQASCLASKVALRSPLRGRRQVVGVGTSQEESCISSETSRVRRHPRVHRNRNSLVRCGHCDTVDRCNSEGVWKRTDCLGHRNGFLPQHERQRLVRRKRRRQARIGRTFVSRVR